MTSVTPEDADALLVDGVCALEDYINEHQRACEKIKQGFFKLTMARRHLAPHALSDLSYHEFFDAVTVVAPRSDHGNTGNDDDDDASDKPSEVHWRLTSPDTNPRASSESSNAITPALTQRKGKNKSKSSTDASETTVSAESQQQQRERQNATILWFSSLPPSDLRQAQTHFRSALQALLYAATSASKVQHCVQTLHEP